MNGFINIFEQIKNKAETYTSTSAAQIKSIESEETQKISAEKLEDE
jgi:hypothetical protein